jgi:hypothetical protein
MHLFSAHPPDEGGAWCHLARCLHVGAGHAVQCGLGKGYVVNAERYQHAVVSSAFHRVLFSKYTQTLGAVMQ